MDQTLAELLKSQAEGQQRLLEAITKLTANLAVNSHQQPPTSSHVSIVDSLTARLTTFSFDPENGCTFDVWLNRYEDVIIKDGQHMDDASRARLIVSKLDPIAYAQFTNIILPSKPADLSYNNTIAQLKDLFGPTKSVFRRRFEFLQVEYNGSGLDEYTGLVKRHFNLSEWKDMTNEQLQCLIWICGFRGQEYADIRTRAIQALESKPSTTLLDLKNDIKRLLEIREDSRAVGSSPTPNTIDINAVHQKRKKHQPNHSSKPPSPCRHCGDAHWNKDCKHQKAECRTCKRKGHLAKVCRSKPNQQRHTNAVIANTTIGRPNRIYKMVTINEREVRMQLDTGAEVTLISYEDWKKINCPPLSPPTVVLKSANQKLINVRGQFSCSFVLNGHNGYEICHVADTATLLGMDWIAQDNDLLSSLTRSVNAIPAASLANNRASLKEHLLKAYPNVFAAGLGQCLKAKASLKLKPDAVPTFRKARPVPYAVLPRVTQELHRLVAENVISPTDHSDFAAPTVVVQKKNGSIRLCADYSTGLNDSLEQHQHPLPTADYIFSTLNQGRFFTQIDLSEAYLQLEVEEDQKKMLTINTHLGLFVYNRLPFGVKSAPAIFQQVMDTMLTGIDGVAAYLDDIIIAGSSIEEHNQRLEATMRRINEFGFRVKREKCSFLMEQIKFLGFIIDARGRRPDPEKINAISQMPAPQDASQLRSFLGLVQFYGQFVKNLHNFRGPLDKLTVKDAKFNWSQQCQTAFDKIKSILQSDLLLTHYNPSLPIIVAADASQYGIGAVITHRMPNGSEKAIAHASRSLTPAQQNYSQIEKEGLALIFAVQKFHRFIQGRHFTLRTDHKPLLSIFGSKKGIPVYSANRLQRWATTLLNYTFSIEYINTKDFGQADALSRLIANHAQEMEKEDTVIASVKAEVVAEYPIISKIFLSPQMLFNVQQDSLLKNIISLVKNGSWKKPDQSSPLWSFYSRRNNLSIINDCLMFAHRIVIPRIHRRRVLQTLHKAHPGMERMKRLARSFVYWPNIDKDIESLVHNCHNCQSAAKNPRKTHLEPWPTPTAPWTRVHADYAGPIDGIYYLIIVDAYSKWPEIAATSSITSSATINILNKVFAQFGNPETLVTDNGTQFSSSTFRQFCTARGINQMHSPPFHPQSNGQAERFVDTFKRALVKLKGEETTNSAVQTFLLSYRSTPCASSPNQKSPAENFIGRKLRTVMDLLMPHSSSPIERHHHAMEDQFNKHHGTRDRQFNINENVYVKDFRYSKTTWAPAFIIRRTGKVTYLVNCQGKVWTRHANQIRHRNHQQQLDHLLDTFDLPSLPENYGHNVNLPTSILNQSRTPSHCVRRSTRKRQQPTQLNMDPSKKSYKQPLQH